MKVAYRDINEAPEDHLIECLSWPEMNAIHERPKNLAVLVRKPVAAPFALREILSSPFRACQMVYESGDVTDLIGAELDHRLELVSEDALIFYEDVMSIAANFAQVAGSKYVGIRLERIETDGCANFHVDHLGLRLVTTYVGRGTEWLRNSDACREYLGSQKPERIRRSHAEVQRVETGWVAIMKGEKYLMNRGQGLVHRSPAIDGLNEPRLFLRMDAIE